MSTTDDDCKEKHFSDDEIAEYARQVLKALDDKMIEIEWIIRKQDYCHHDFIRIMGTFYLNFSISYHEYMAKVHKTGVPNVFLTSIREISEHFGIAIEEPKINAIKKALH